MKTSRLRIVTGFALLLAYVVSAQAQLLLTVDWSNLSAVKITATGNTPAFSYNNGPEDTPVYAGGASSFQGEDGITMMNFLTSAYSVAQVDVGPLATTSTLKDFSGNSTFDQLYTMDQSGSVVGLNIYAANTSGYFIFANGESAFTGEAVFDLSDSAYSALVARLPGLGASGSIVMWNTYDYPLGTWSVTGAASAVPEPSTYAAIIGGLALLGVMGRRYRQKRA